MLHALRYVAVRHREHSGPLGCDVSRIVGYRWLCSCGERGPVRTTVADSRSTAVEHQRTASTQDADHLPSSVPSEG
jgi:hypothetical protein